MARRRKKASDKTSLYILLAIIAVLTIMAGMFYASISGDKNTENVGGSTGGGKKEVISLINESIEAQRIFSIFITANGSIEHASHNGQNSDNRQ